MEICLFRIYQKECIKHLLYLKCLIYDDKTKTQ